MPRIRIEYYALLREQRGENAEDLDTRAATPTEVYAELRARHGFTIDSGALKVVVNEEFATWDTPLRDRDTIVFIPPVAGG